MSYHLRLLPVLLIAQLAILRTTVFIMDFQIITLLESQSSASHPVSPEDPQILVDCLKFVQYGNFLNLIHVSWTDMIELRRSSEWPRYDQQERFQKLNEIWEPIFTWQGPDNCPQFADVLWANDILTTGVLVQGVILALCFSAFCGQTLMWILFPALNFICCCCCSIYTQYAAANPFVYWLEDPIPSSSEERTKIQKHRDQQIIQSASLALLALGIFLGLRLVTTWQD